MSEHPVKIPDSYFCYLDNSDHIDLLDKNPEPLTGFDFQDIKKFWQAKASLALCKRDYFEFLLKIFHDTWEEAIKGSDFSSLTKAEMDIFDSGISLSGISLDNAWQRSEMTWYFRNKKTNLVIMGSLVPAKEGRGLRLCTAATMTKGDKDGWKLEKDEYGWKLGEKMELADNAWEDIGKDGDIYGKITAKINFERQTMDISELIACAKQAVEAAKRLADIK